MCKTALLLAFVWIEAAVAAPAPDPPSEPRRVLGLVPASGEEKDIDPAEIVTLVAPLAHADADDLLEAFETFLLLSGPAGGSEVCVVRSASANALIIASPHRRVPYLRDLIRSLDQERAGATWFVEVVDVKGLADAIAQAVQEILKAQAGQPEPPKGDAKAGSDPRPAARVLAAAGSNRLIIGAPSDEEMRRIRSWIAKIDAPEDAPAPEIVREIIPLKALRIERAVELVNALMAARSAAASSGPSARAVPRPAPLPRSSSPDQRFVQFPERNALIFQGTQEELEEVRKILALVDVATEEEAPAVVVTKVFPVKVLRPQRAIELVSELLGVKSSAAPKSSPPSPSMPRPATPSSSRPPTAPPPSSTLPRLVPHEEGDTIIFQGTEAEAEEVRKILEMIDRESGER